jgi:hypothetical protein
LLCRFALIPDRSFGGGDLNTFTLTVLRSSARTLLPLHLPTMLQALRPSSCRRHPRLLVKGPDRLTAPVVPVAGNCQPRPLIEVSRSIEQLQPGRIANLGVSVIGTFVIGGRFDFWHRLATPNHCRYQKQGHANDCPYCDFLGEHVISSAAPFCCQVNSNRFKNVPHAGYGPDGRIIRPEYRAAPASADFRGDQAA